MLLSVKNKAEKANTNTKLLNSIQELINYGKPIEFNYTIHKFIAILSLIVFFTYNAVLFTDQLTELLIFKEKEENFFFALIFLVSGIIPIVIMYNGQSTLDDLSDYIFNKDKIQDNELVYINDSGYFNKLKSHFSSNFSKGNYSRQFKYGYESNNGNFYHFEYVDSQTVMVPVTTSSTDSNGNTTTTTTMQQQTVYHYYNRYGFTIESNDLKSIDIEKEKELLSSLEDLSIRVEGNIVCIETDTNLLRSKKGRQFSVESPKEFYSELKGFTELEHLTDLLKFKSLLV
jgi:hypothetical protein